MAMHKNNNCKNNLKKLAQARFYAILHMCISNSAMHTVAITLRFTKKCKTMQKQTQTQTAIIYKYIKANKLCTAQQIASALNINVNSVHKMLYAMQQHNYITKFKVATVKAMYVANARTQFTTTMRKAKRKATKHTATAKRTQQSNKAHSIILNAQQAIVALQQLIKQVA